MTHEFPPWVRQAAALPVAFAQVREDALLDLWVADRLPQRARVLLVASGGCTAALLATAPNIEFLDLVDPNPAQLALCRLKLYLLQAAEPTLRMALLGHSAMDIGERRSRLAEMLRAVDLPEDSLGASDFVARVGPDHAGRYERLFAALRDELADFSDEIMQVLQHDDLLEQQRRVAPSSPLGRRLDEALEVVMALPNLVCLFGEAATNNPAEPFSRHFARRIRHVLATLPARSNPYLWQMLRGCYPAGSKVPWIDQAAPRQMPKISYSKALVVPVLERKPEPCDFLHLSNVVDWLTPQEAMQTLRHAYQALRPGGWVFLRQLNSTLDIPRLGSMFDWQQTDADALHARDRSFFYRRLHLGRRK